MGIAKGLSAYPITPIDGNGQINVAILRQLVARLVTARVDAIGLLGSTGIYMYLTRQERRRALEVAIDQANSRIPITAGIGALRTDDAVRFAQDARAIGATAGLLSAVSYTTLTEDEVFTHFSTVSKQSGLPIIIYDNPGTTHFTFTPTLVGRLVREEVVVAIKNPGWKAGDAAKLLADQRALASQDFSIGCSADWTATETMIAGADLWHSVLAGLFPHSCLGIARAAQRGDATEARRLDSELAPIWDLFREHSSLRVVYALAGILGICPVDPPLPILPLSASKRRQVADTFKRLPAHIIQ